MRLSLAKRRPFWLSQVVLIKLMLLWTSVTLAQSVPGDIIDLIREAAIDSFDPEKLGAGYALQVSFAVNPDISAARLYPHEPAGVNDSVIKAYKIPLRYVFNKDKKGWRPFVQALGVYQDFDAAFDIIDDETVDAEWDTYGGILSAGIEIPVTDNLLVLSTVSAGYAHIENSAAYNGPLGNAIFKPALENLVFDWDADASLLGASLGANYQQQLSSFKYEITGDLAYSRVKTFDSSSEFIEFSSDVLTLDLELNTIHPTSWTFQGYPLAVVVLLGTTAFLGQNRDAFEFDHFFETGLALEADLSAKGRRLKRIRLGLKGIYAKDVTGWGLIAGYRL